MQTIDAAITPKNENIMVVLGADGVGAKDFRYSLGKMHSIMKALPAHR